MNYEYLNEMILYIEDNLTENIEYKTLARIVGISEYSLQRIFVFLTGISISEYIKKRRLSKAFEELKNTNIKIIDLALKYHYNSSQSFSRAFKKEFNLTPLECRKNSEKYKLFPMIVFKNNNFSVEYNYEIKENKQEKIYCLKVQDENHDDYLYKIRELYKKIKKNGIYKKFNEVGMCAISIHTKDMYTYYVGCKEKIDGLEEYIIKEGKYAVYSVKTRMQKDIVNMDRIIINELLPSMDYELDCDINNFYKIEKYFDDYCYVYIPVKDKQK